MGTPVAWAVAPKTQIPKTMNDAGARWLSGYLILEGMGTQPRWLEWLYGGFGLEETWNFVRPLDAHHMSSRVWWAVADLVEHTHSLENVSCTSEEDPSRLVSHNITEPNENCTPNFGLGCYRSPLDFCTSRLAAFERVFVSGFWSFVFFLIKKKKNLGLACDDLLKQRR